MIVEVIAVGTELLLGQIINSNTSTMGAALAERGIDAHYQQTVGDNLSRIASAISVALDRSDADRHDRWHRSHSGRHHQGGGM